MKKLLKPKEAAELLRVSESQLRSLAQRGRIPHYRLSEHALRYDEAELEAWLGTLTLR